MVIFFVSKWTWRARRHFAWLLAVTKTKWLNHCDRTGHWFNIDTLFFHKSILWNKTNNNYKIIPINRYFFSFAESAKESSQRFTKDVRNQQIEPTEKSLKLLHFTRGRGGEFLDLHEGFDRTMTSIKSRAICGQLHTPYEYKCVSLQAGEGRDPHPLQSSLCFFGIEVSTKKQYLLETDKFFRQNPPRIPIIDFPPP